LVVSGRASGQYCSRAPKMYHLMRCSHCRFAAHKSVLWPVRSWVLVCRWWQFDGSFARLIAPVVTPLPSSLAPIKSRMETSANPGPPGKWLLKWRARNLTKKLAWHVRQRKHLVGRHVRLICLSDLSPTNQRVWTMH